jgi:RES domain-containing protein
VKIFSGLVWRHVPRGAHALHIGWILRAAGRWNRQGVYGALYTALTREGALAEYQKLLRLDLIPSMHKRDLVSIRVNRIGPVLDLTASDTQKALDVTVAVLTGDDTEHIETCRAIADWARGERYVGILTPSATLAGYSNLVIYVDGTARNIDLDVGVDREPI